ncbi:MAG: ABC transporter permease [Candidatus Odinarchaeota archaeon]
MISAEAEEVAEVPMIRKRPSAVSNFWKQYKKSRMGLIGLSIMIFFILVAIFAPVLAPYDPSPNNVVAPVYATPLVLSIFDDNPLLPVEIGNDINCEDLSKWDVLGYVPGPYGSVGMYSPMAPTNITDAEDHEHLDLTAANYGREGLEVSEQVDNYEDNTDGKVFGITVNTTKDDYSDGGNIGVVLRQNLDWSMNAYDNPDTGTEIPKNLTIYLRYRIEFTGDLADPAKFSGTQQRKHFSLNMRILKDEELSTPLGMMKFPMYPVYTVDNPTTYYGTEDKFVNYVLIVNYFMSDGPVGTTNPRKSVNFQLEAMFQDLGAFNGSINVVIDKFYMEVQGRYFGVLGSTRTGADVFSQLIYGTQVSLIVGVLATFFSVTMGIIVGLVSGYVAGRVDDLLMRFVDFLLIMPGLPLMLVLASVLRPSFWNIIIVISVLGWTGTARIIRAQTLSEKEKAYVKAARAAGGSDLYIIFRHILPNVLPIVFAQMATGISGAIQSEAAISFLGLGGIEISWGKMLQESTQGAFSRGAWWIVIFPGLCVCLLSLAFILVGHTIEQVVNPRLREL